MAEQVEQAGQVQVASLPKINAITISYVTLALAIVVSGYLSYLKAANATAACAAVGQIDCGTVLNSAYSELGGIPIAWLGLGTNLVILALIAFRNRVALLREFGTILTFGVILFAFVYSVYLVYLQAFVIQAYCPWCLTHEVLITILFVVWARQAWLSFEA